MAKVIVFYIPDSLPKKARYTDRKERGKLIEIPSPKTNRANFDSAQWQGIGPAYVIPQ